MQFSPATYKNRHFLSLKVITFESLLDIKYLCGVLSDAWSCFLSATLWPESEYLILHDYVHLVLINTPLFWVVITITFTADIVDTGNNKNAI